MASRFSAPNHKYHMRDLIRLTEGLAASSISEVIVRLGKEYIEKGLASSLYEINNGLCEDFARDVCSALGGDNSMLFVEWADAYSVNGEGDEWDVPLLQRQWPKCQPTHGLTWQDTRYEVPRHAWIVFNNRHYDAECPEGVDNFFELPLMRRVMERMAKKLAKRKTVSEKVEQLAEMATAPPESMKGQTFYHGTSSSKSAKAILRDGLVPPQQPKRGGHLTPVNGMVYLTPDLGYALIYAIGGNILGSESYRKPYRGENKAEFERVFKARDGSIERYGYIFAIEADAFTAVQPDEDQVGELYHYMLSGSDPNPRYTEANFMRAWESLKGDPVWWNRFLWHMNTHTTPTQKEKIKFGYFAYYAAGGKRAIAKMSDEMKAWLCGIGVHIAHQGKLKPTACWQIDKAKVGYLNKDGSNFFEFAKRIR